MLAPIGSIEPERDAKTKRSMGRATIASCVALTVLWAHGAAAQPAQTGASPAAPAGAATPPSAQSQPAAPAANPAAASPAAAPQPASPPPTVEAGASSDSAVDGPQDELAPSLNLLPLTSEGAGGLTAGTVASQAVAVSGRAMKATAHAKLAEVTAGRAYSLFLPRLNLTARYTRLSDIDLSGSPLQNFGGNFPIYFPNNYLLQASVRIPVSEYFMTLSDHYKSAQKLEMVRAMEAKGTHQAVAHEAVRDYYQLALAVAADQIAKHRVEQLTRFVEEIRLLVDGGELRQVELSQAQARLAGAQALSEQTEANLHYYEQDMRILLGLELDKPVGVAEPLTAERPAAPDDLVALLKRADLERPELVALRTMIEAQQHTRDATAGTRYPAVSLFGNVDVANPNQRYFPLNDQFRTTWAAGVELTWSPTDLATHQTELDQQETTVTSFECDLRDLRARVALEVTNAYEQALAAEAAVESSEVAVASADEALQVRMALFHGGEGTPREVLDAELELRQAQLDWLTNVLNTHLAQVDLEHATGQLKF